MPDDVRAALQVGKNTKVFQTWLKETAAQSIKDAETKAKAEEKNPVDDEL